MSLQNLELNQAIVRELYGDLLVGDEKKPGTSAPPKTKTAPPLSPAETKSTFVEEPGKTLKFLGGNNRKIAFIVNNKAAVYLPEKDLEWLGKLLDACRLNLGDVAILNAANAQFSISDLKNELKSQSVILLGSEPGSIQLPMNFPMFNLQTYDGMVFLITPSPSELNQATQEARLLKSKLWVCLQKLFNL